MSAIAALILSLWAAAGVPTASGHQATVAPCSDRTDVVSVWRDDPTPCDVQPGQRIDIYGVTLSECDTNGGEYILTATVPATFVCEGVDD